MEGAGAVEGVLAGTGEAHHVRKKAGLLRRFEVGSPPLVRSGAEKGGLGLLW